MSVVYLPSKSDKNNGCKQNYRCGIYATGGVPERPKGRTERSNAGQPARAPRAPKQEASRSRSRNSAPSRDEDPGLVLISRRPPQQKFTNFEEYMNAHGGATAPIEDHSDEV